MYEATSEASALAVLGEIAHGAGQYLRALLQAVLLPDFAGCTLRADGHLSQEWLQVAAAPRPKTILRGEGGEEKTVFVCQLGAPVVPFLTLFWGRVPLLK